MFCSKCGQQNDDTGSFCVSCGAALAKAPAPTAEPTGAAPPPMREPMQQPARQFSAPPPPGVNTHPYKTEFVLSLIGSILGAIFFIAIIATGIDEFYYNEYDGTMVIISGVFTLASFILGFVGMAIVRKGRGSGGVPLVIGGGLGFVAMFFGYIGPITMFYYPLILAAGIVALARRKHVEGNYPQP